MSDRVLLTLLGKAHRTANYTLHGRTVKAAYAGIALLELLGEEAPDRVVVLVTPEARELSLPGFEEALAAGGEVPLDVRDLRDTNDLDQTLQDLLEAVPAGAEVRLDLTHAFRHLALLGAGGAALLELTRGVTVAGIHYGVENGPMLELGPLYELPRWMVALRLLQDTGATSELAALLDPGRGGDAMALEAAGALRRFDRAWRAGLPLEAGREACRVQQLRRPLGRVLGRWPYTQGLRDQILDDLQEVALPADPGGDGWKSKVAFDADEEARQLRMIRRSRERGQVAQAIAMAREWLVSKAVIDGAAWLERDPRKAASHRLSSLAARVEAGLVGDPDARSLAAAWKTLRDDLRNYVMHAGMRREDALAALDAPAVLEGIEAWHGRALPLDLGGGGARLITPVGLTPGSVFTVVRRLEEAEGPLAGVVLVGSPESLPLGRGALEVAGYAGPVLEHAVADAFADYEAALARVRQVRHRSDEASGRLLGFLAEAGLVWVNLSGGTTLLGIVAEALADEARKLGVRKRRVAVSDRRPPDEQRADPHVLGELHHLDA